MKFEQLLKIYWTRKFLYGGQTFDFGVNLSDFFANLNGLSTFSQIKIIKRFELTSFENLYFHSGMKNIDIIKSDNSKLIKSKKITTDRLFSQYPIEFRKLINMYLGKLVGVRNSIFELLRFNIIRLYLIKSFRGRAQALGKPSRGQRTWSNACTAFNTNFIMKDFLKLVKLSLKKHQKIEKKDYKKVKLLVRKAKPKIKKIKPVSLLQTWF
jgi:ribosomal protein S13